MPRSPRTLFALLLALSLLVGGWPVSAGSSCGGPCCAAELPALGPMDHGGAVAAVLGAGCSCCGSEQAPCDLEQGRAPDTPPRALTAAPKVERPVGVATVLAVLAPATGRAEIGMRCSGATPPGRAPPLPLYLHYLSLLC